MRSSITAFFILLAPSGLFSDALDDYTRAYSLYSKNPQSIEAMLKLAEASLSYEEWDQVRSLLKKIYEQQPDNLNALLLEGTLLFKQHLYDQAGVVLGKILEIDAHSTQAKEARTLVSTLQKSSKWRASHNVALLAGFDSNVNVLNQNQAALGDYLFNLWDCAMSPCDFSAIESRADLFTLLSATGNYLHDFGSASGFFATYGWQIQAKSYTQEQNYNYEHWSIGTGLGYQSFLGQFDFAFDVGGFSTHLPYLDPFMMTQYDGIYYHTLRFAPTYSYGFESGAIFSMGFVHESGDSKEQATYFDSFTGIPYSYTLSSISNDMGYLQFANTAGISNWYQLRAYIHSRHTYINLDGFDPGDARYERYGEAGGVSLLFYHFLNPKLAFTYDVMLENRVYENGYIQSGYTLSSIKNDQRRDYMARARVELAYTHSDDMRSAIGYILTNNASNYTPQAYTRHELYYALYWRP